MTIEITYKGTTVKSTFEPITSVTKNEFLKFLKKQIQLVTSEIDNLSLECRNCTKDKAEGYGTNK